MKKVLLTLFKHSSAVIVLLAMIVGPFQPLIAQAEQQPAGVTSAQSAAASGTGIDASVGPSVQQASLTLNANGTGVQQAATGGTGTPTSGCNLTSDWSLCVTNVVYVFTVGIGSGFAYVAAYFFDWAISLSLNGGAYALTFVSTGWTTARDLANMAFLFILLYIAFKIMFEAETGETTHMLVLVVIIALLVNFSFFFTRLAIDAGNIMAIQFYNAIDAPSLAATAAGSGVQGNVLNTLNIVTPSANLAGNSKDLTASIMGMLNFQGLFSSDAFNNWYKPQTGGGPSFLVVVISLSFLYIAAGIMFWILTVAFVTNGIKFLFRIVILWFLIIASPLAFVARAVPKMSGYFDKWLDALIKHAFYPVAFMFVFLILSNFATQMACTTASTCSQGSLIGGLFAGLQGATAASPVAAIAIAAANIFIRLGFVIAMLYIGMKAADTIGVMGADAAKHAGNWMGGKLIGTYGAAGRNTVGWAGNRLAATTALRNLETRSGPLGLFGRGLRSGLGSVGRASFDARGIPGTGSVLKGMGKAQVDGYEGDLKKRIERMEKQAKALEPSAGQKAVALEKAEEEKGYTLEEAKKTNEAAKKDLGAAQKRLNDLKDKEGTKEWNEAKSNLERAEGSGKVAFARMKVLEDLAKEKSGEGNAKKYADTLTKPNIRNLWNLGMSAPWRANADAAAKIRKGKSVAEEILEHAKHAIHEDEAAKGGGEGQDGEGHGGGGGGGGAHATPAHTPTPAAKTASAPKSGGDSHGPAKH